MIKPLAVIVLTVCLTCICTHVHAQDTRTELPLRVGIISYADVQAACKEDDPTYGAITITKNFDQICANLNAHESAIRTDKRTDVQVSTTAESMTIYTNNE